MPTTVNKRKNDSECLYLIMSSMAKTHANILSNDEVSLYHFNKN